MRRPRKIRWPALALASAVAFADVGKAEEPEGGGLRAEIRFAGQVPTWPLIRPDKNRDHCGDTLANPVLRVHEGGVADAVVAIERPAGEIPAALTEEPLRLSSSHCRLEPRIQAGRAGALLVVGSGDEITHNPHGWWNGRRSVFNLTLPDPSRSFRRKLRWPGLYRVDCDTHSWMRAYILLFEHPYFAVTDAAGEAEIDGIPAGRHRVRVWHEVLGERSAEVEVENGKTARWRVFLSLAAPGDGKTGSGPIGSGIP